MTTAESVEVAAVLVPTVVVTSTKQNDKQSRYLGKYRVILYFGLKAGLFNFPNRQDSLKAEKKQILSNFVTPS